MSDLSPTDETILALSQEGRNDAEIAVRLGLTVGDVRERRERLRASVPGSVPKSRAAASPRRIPRWLLALAAIFVAGWVAFGLYLEFSGGGSTTAPVGRTIDLGRVVLTPHGEAIQVDERPALTVLTVPDGTVIRSADKKAWSQHNNAPVALVLQKEREDGPIQALFFKVDDATTFEADWSGGVRVTATGGEDSATVLIISRTRAGGIRTVNVDESGMVSLALAPLPKNLAINMLTGEALDVDNATRLGKLPGWGSTRCGDAETPTKCVVDWLPEDGGEGLAPFEGALSCGSDGSWYLRSEATGYRLLFDGVGPDCSRTEATRLPMRVSAGEKLGIPDGPFALTARRPDGQPTSLAIAGDGTLYAGDIVPKVACPCVDQP